MSNYEVTNMAEVNYIGMPKKEREGIWRIEDLRLQQMCTSFDDENDYYALYRNLDVKDGDSNDDRTYAVYLHNGGKLLCLLVDAGVALEGYEDVDYGCKRAELYRQIAIEAGWPEILPKPRFTVRLHRIVDVEVRADNEKQAQEIGLKLANREVDAYIKRDLDDAWKANSNGGYDYVGFVKPAEPEEDGVWDMVFNETECNQILKED